MKTYSQDILSHESAIEILQQAIYEASKYSIAITITKVDPGLKIVAQLSMDGATPHSIETSRRKAQAAVSTKKSTGWMDSSLEISLPMASGNILTNIPGGMPIKRNGTVVAALGIAGGTVQQDADIAKILTNIN